MARFRVLGPVLVMDESHTPVALGRKERLLLAALLTRPDQVLGPELLAGEIWGDDRPADMVRGLRVFVSRLRRVVPGGTGTLVTQSGGYSLETDDIDAIEFERGIRAARTEFEAGRLAASLAAYDEALSLWRGEAYAGLHGRPLVDLEVRRLTALRDKAELERIEALVSSGRYDDAITVADRLILLHPTQERLRVLQIQALLAAGGPGEALAAWDTAVGDLAARGLSPSLTLTQVRARLLHGSLGGATVAPPLLLELPLSLARERSVPLVGRVDELAVVLEAARRATTGAIRAIFISGEAGIGKSRLAAEAASFLRHEGWLVLHGRCDAQGALRYQPLAEALGSLAAAVGLEELEGRVGRLDLGQVSPRFKPREPARRSAEPALDREGLFEHVADVLDALASGQPVVWVVDDLHLADPTMGTLMRHLVRRPWRAPLLLMLTHREEYDGGLRSTRSLVEDLRRDNSAAMVSLQPLGEGAIHEVASWVSGSAPSPAITEYLAAQTGGNPFLLTELTRHLHGLGVLGLRDPVQVRRTIAETAMPDGVRDLFEHTLRGLPEGTVVMLSVGAVAGREFDLEVVADVCGLAVENLVELARRAVVARLLVEIPHAPGQYSFGHELIREHLLRSMPALVRSRRHRALAEVLTRRGAPASVLASHHDATGSVASPQLGVRLHRSAAEEARRCLAFESEADHLEAALRWAEGLPDQEQVSVRTELVLKVADAWWQAGDLDRADRWYLRAIDLGKAGDDSALWAQGVLGHCRTSPSASERYAPTVDRELVALVEEAIAATPDEPALQAQLIGRLALMRYWDATLTELTDLAGRAVRLARSAGDPHALVEVLVCRQLATWTTGEALVRLERSVEILALADRLGATYHEAEVRLVRVLDLLELGDVQAADRERARYQALAHTLRQPFFGWHLHFLNGTRALMNGRFRQAADHTDQALSVSDEAGATGPVALWGLQHLWAWHEQGRADLLSSAVESIQSVAPAMVAVKVVQAWVAADCGDLASARTWLAEAASAGWDTVRRDTACLVTLAFAAETAVALEDHEQAALLRGQLEPFRDLNILAWASFNAGPVSLYLGRLELLLGSAAKAVEHFEAAERSAGEAGSRPVLARARSELARALISLDDAGSRVRSRRLLDSAESTAATLGMVGLQQRVAEVRGLLHRAPDGPPWERLTPAQLRVARLAAEGASNPEIAKTLHLSRHTVEAHMGAVLRTLGLRSRLEIVAQRASLDTLP